MRSMLLILSLIGLVSCADSGSKWRYGETTKAALVAEKGPPDSIERPLGGSKTEVLVYAGNEKFQVTNDVVVAGFRNPTEEERSLIYWRHYFKDCTTSFTELAAVAGHLRPEKEFKCAHLGLSVIYDPNIDQVTRVVGHAEK